MLLVVVLGGSGARFCAAESFSAVLNDVLIYFNFFLSSSWSGRIKAVLGGQVVYDSEEAGVERFPEALAAEPPARPSLSADFALALLLINASAGGLRGTGAADGALHRGPAPGRILLFLAEKYRPQSYSNYVKCIFSCKKAAVPVDCLSIVAEGRFTKQLIGILDGTTYSPPASAGGAEGARGKVLSYLLSTLSLNKRLDGNKVAFSAICLCHKSPIHVGYLCPLCLGVYCKFVPICKHCKTRFSF